MSTKSNIIVRDEINIRKEWILYQHNDGHPTVMITTLVSTLKEIFDEFQEFGDEDWFLDPSRVVGSLISKSIPKVNEDIQRVISTLEEPMRSRLESSLLLGMPQLLPDVGRSQYCNYEYVITLKESYESTDMFKGYHMSVHKMINGKRVLDITDMEENFYRSNYIMNSSETILVEGVVIND